METSEFTVTTRDGIELYVTRWAPETDPEQPNTPARGAIQVQHGLAEHTGRYERFARALTDAGYLVYGPDARGSGRTAAGAYGTWGPDGWQGWVNDIGLLNARIRADHPGLPVGLFAHSMGSFAAQHYLLEHSGRVDAVVLSGTTEVAGLVQLLSGDGPTDLSAFNLGFEQRTGYEWLSRDAAEVDKYVADEACGWSASAPAGMDTLVEAADPQRLRGIRPDLPVLLVSGDADPIAAGGGAVELVGQRYRDAGLREVTVRLYPQARHELLNETNRDEVTREIIAFFDRALTR